MRQRPSAGGSKTGKGAGPSPATSVRLIRRRTVEAELERWLGAPPPAGRPAGRICQRAQLQAKLARLLINYHRSASISSASGARQLGARVKSARTCRNQARASWGRTESHYLPACRAYKLAAGRREILAGAGASAIRRSAANRRTLVIDTHGAGPRLHVAPGRPIILPARPLVLARRTARAAPRAPPGEYGQHSIRLVYVARLANVQAKARARSPARQPGPLAIGNNVA